MDGPTPFKLGDSARTSSGILRGAGRDGPSARRSSEFPPFGLSHGILRVRGGQDLTVRPAPAPSECQKRDGPPDSAVPGARSLPEDPPDASAIESPPPVAASTSRPGLAALAVALARPGPALAGKVSWLDEVVQEVIREAGAGGKAAARGEGDRRAAAGRLFAREADEGLETVARRSDALARSARQVESPSEALLQARFGRLLRPEPETARAFAALAPAEKRVVVEMGEAAQQLARRYPGQAEAMVRKLGTEGLSAVRVYGDDVAEVVVKEGPEALGVLRKTGRGGWKFFTEQVLPQQEEAGRRRASSPRSWPTPTSSSTPPAGPPSTPSASSPGPGSTSPGPSAPGPPGAWKARSATPWPPTG